MKRNVSLREIVLLALLLVIVGYYYFVQVPIQAQTDQIAIEQADVLSEIDTKMAVLTVQKNMQTELDEVYAAYNGNPPHMPDYDNADAVITQLNAILAPAEDFTISFRDGAAQGTSYVMRRAAMLTYTTQDYSTALSILKTLSASGFENQISDLNIVNNTFRVNPQDARITVSLVITYYEYYGAA